MIRRLSLLLKRINHWNFVWITVIFAEIFTAGLNTLQSYIYHGVVKTEHLVMGTIDAFVVSLLIAPVVIYFIRNNDELEKNNEDLRSAIDARNESEQKIVFLQKALEMIPIGVTVSDNEGKIVYTNQAEAALHGYSVDELIGRSAQGLAPAVNRPVQSLAKIEDDIWRRETTNLKKDGTEFPVKLTSILIRTPEGQTDGIVTVCEDITEQKHAEIEQKKLESQLLQIQKMDSIGRLAGGIAHDFNNILSAIIGYSEIALLKLPKDSPVRETIQTVKDAGNRAADLTHQLLAFSRKQVLRMEAININRTIESMAKMLGRIIGEDISLELKTGSSVNSVLADARQIEQVILNLAVNARDAMPNGGSLMIETSDVELDGFFQMIHEEAQPGMYVLISIIDTGTGMTREVKEKIFEPFFTTKELGKGTGLGLATVYGIIKQHNGLIYVQSKPDRGTTFRIYLPATTEHISHEPNIDSCEMPAGTETIIVVDDDILVRRLAVDTLQPLGYTVLEASNGRDAVEAIDSYQGNIDLMLTDVIMPGINGAELARVFQSKRPGKKVIFMSGYTDDAISSHGVLNNNVVLINKPLLPHRLTQEVRTVLDRQTSGR